MFRSASWTLESEVLEFKFLCSNLRGMLKIIPDQALCRPGSHIFELNDPIIERNMGLFGRIMVTKFVEEIDPIKYSMI